ncbi:MAG: DNA-3-methyladenine glycosylase [Cyanobacteria bacterium J06627_15]
MSVTNRNREAGAIAPAFTDPDSWFSFTRQPATTVAPVLVGCRLHRRWPNGDTCSGLIVETEAYLPDDPACHAYRGRTASNAHMFGPPGYSYVYFIYGMYHCLNVVTAAEGMGSAVLIRAVALAQVPAGVDDKGKPNRVAAGPGKLCRTLQIDRSDSGLAFTPENSLWVSARTPVFEQALATQEQTLTQTIRIGLSKAVEQPWRWYLTGHPAVSKP